MKTMKKAAAVAVAMGLAVTGSGLSFAAETTTAAETYKAEMTGKDLENNGTADSVITGHIKVTSISVQVPIKSAFDIDPNKSISVTAPVSTGDVQMGTQADNYSIINNSTVPLDISITKVAANGAQLVSTVADLDAADKNVAFAIREKSETAPTVPVTANDAVWMKNGDLSATPYKVATADAKNTIQAKNDDPADKTDELQMKVYALTTKGWKAGESFTVTPTFTVSLHEATTPAP